GAEQPINLPPDSYWGPRLSPEGSRIAVVRSKSPGRRFEIDVVDLKTGKSDPFADGVWPEWTPDGSIAFTKYGLALVVRPVGRPDIAERLLAPSTALIPSFSNRPVVMSYQGTRAGREELRVVPLDPQHGPQPALLASDSDIGGYLSPDARYV